MVEDPFHMAGPPPTIRDQPLLELAQLCVRINWERIAREQHARLLADALRRASVPLGLYSGKEAADLLATLIQLVEAQVHAHVKMYSPARWLWYLRRLPDSMFAGDHRTTLGYDTTLAEALTWAKNGQEFSVSGKTLSFRKGGTVEFIKQDSTCRHPSGLLFVESGLAARGRDRQNHVGLGQQPRWSV